MNRKEIQDVVDGNVEVVSLNLILDYPVKWSKYKVLRDFLQNFYDAVGHENWQRKFQCEVTDQHLTFQSEGIGFSYDWLIHIGASTKRNQEAAYAGYFGEGFKIAALCACRDYQWNIHMSSRDWELEVTTDEIQIDHKHLVSLAYRIRHNTTYQANTVLRIFPFTSSDTAILDSARFSFYYKENPLFGDPIWVGADAAVYHRSSAALPCQFPSTFRQTGDGIIYAGYQALGSFNYPLIFALHGFRLDDRERNTFYIMEVMKVIKQVAAQITPMAAAILLGVMQNTWHRYPEEKYDFDSWYGVIRRLTHTLAQSPLHTELFHHNYPRLLVIHRIKSRDLYHSNRRRQALSWLAQADTHYDIVQDGFGLLGYPVLEDVCEQQGGFAHVRRSAAREKPMIDLLEKVTLHILPDFFGDTFLPICKVIESNDAAWAGVASCVRLQSPKQSLSGFKIRYQLPYIGLKERLFHPNCFGEALSTYLHELAHRFGGDHSASFSRALTAILSVVIDQVKVIDSYEEEWNSYARCER